ncbi:MAG: hypothetical protein ABS76_13370 [Pelagibacterium sp. SCN 64-44]|nr:MAG: hypothetical protein ABS76_13370 [Pelagibacterium sp. SCN 64-44]
MAKASEQFRQSDVVIWGLVALMAGALAVMSANVSALAPPSLLAALHQTRLEGASVNQLRQDVADLRRETQRLSRASEQLNTRFDLAEETGNTTARRVGALEVTLPQLAESQRIGQLVDRSLTTAGIGEGQGVSFPTEGGSVTIRQQPLAVGGQPEPAPLAPREAALTLPSGQSYGIALGAAIDAEAAPQAWRDLSMKLGPLLFGLTPHLAESSDGAARRIVVGPIPQLSEASAICARLERLEVSCQPMPFAGEPLNP